MKTMILTGLGSEQNFSNGSTSYFLVFNDGEFRVSINETEAELVINEMYSTDSNNHSNKKLSEPTDDAEINQI